MFYKRPRFRRGGSTGIDSLTPRVKAQMGFPNFGLPQAPSQQQIDAFRQAEADRLARIRAQSTFAPTRSMPYRPGFSFLGSGITSPAGTTPVAPTRKTSEGGLGDFFRRSIIGRRYTGEDPDAGMMNFSTNTGFGFLKPGVRFDRDVEQTIRSAPTKEDELPLYDEDEREGGAIDISKLVPEKRKPKTPEIKLDDDDTDTGERSFENDFKTEVAKINKALGKKGGIDKGELALMLADAIGTKGTIADKAKTLSGALRKKIATDKATDRQIAMLAYKTVGDLRKAEIMAGKRTYSEKVGERLRKLNKIINDPNESSERIEEAKRLKKIELESIPGGAVKDQYLTGRDSLAAVDERNKFITRLAKEKAKPKNAQNAAKIANLENQIETTNKLLRPDLRRSFADGSPKPPEMEAPTPEEVSRTPSAQVSKLGYDELRNRLPKEITDDVIQLISDSEEALRDFAYIRTQGDVDKFNVKYGVTLVLPPTT